MHGSLENQNTAGPLQAQNQITPGHRMAFGSGGWTGQTLGQKVLTLPRVPAAAQQPVQGVKAGVHHERVVVLLWLLLLL